MTNDHSEVLAAFVESGRPKQSLVLPIKAFGRKVVDSMPEFIFHLLL